MAISESEKDASQKTYTMIFGISGKAMNLIKKRIEQLRNEVRSIVHKDNEKPENVYEIFLHIHPILKK
jgi:hypothetical protein